MRPTILVVLLTAATAACQSPSAPSASPSSGSAASASTDAALRGGGPSTTGGGHYLLLDSLDTRFAFSAVNGGAGPSGRFHQKLTFQGFAVEFHGEVTCVTTDPANSRAWVGGVITANNSAHPSFQAERHQPGHDVWFRVLDSGEGASAAPDRTTFLGFEGDAGFATSAAYCAGQPWPDDNARTWPVTEGNIQVRP